MSTQPINKKIREGFLGQKMIVLPPNIKKLVVGNSLTRNLYLTAIGYYPKATHHDRERKHGINEYILLYCADGEGAVSVKGHDLTLTPNTYLIVPKNTAHRYRSSVTLPWSIYWVHFSGPNADVLFERYQDGVSAPVIHPIPYDKERISRFDRIYQILARGFDERAIEVANLEMATFLTSLIYQQELAPLSQETDGVNISINFMKAQIGQKLTINDLALKSGLSVSHYSRLFRQRTGDSPVNYFNLLKVQQSCQYLYFTDLSIKEIAAELGFDDQYYFSRLFTKLIGTSPLKYRNTHKK